MSSLICHFLPCSLQASNIELLRVPGRQRAVRWRPASPRAPPGTASRACVPDTVIPSTRLSENAASSEKPSRTPTKSLLCPFSGDLTQVRAYIFLYFVFYRSIYLFEKERA